MGLRLAPNAPPPRPTWDFGRGVTFLWVEARRERFPCRAAATCGSSPAIHVMMGSRLIILTLTLAAPLPCLAQQEGTPRAPADPPQRVALDPPPVDDPGLVVPLVVGVRGLVLLVDGTALEGRALWIDRGSATLRVDAARPRRRTPPASILNVPLREIRGFVPLLASGQDLTGNPVRLVLEDGSVVGGQLVERSAERVVLGGEAGERRFPRGRVRSVHPVEGAVAAAPIGERHLEVASAALPPPGNLRFTLQGVHLVGTYGVVEHVAVEVGTAVPLGRADSYGRNVQAVLRGGVEVLPCLALSAGLQLEAGSPGLYAGRLLASVTGRLPRVAVTLYAGPTFAAGDTIAGLGDLSVAAAASVRASRRLDVVGELWISGLDGVRDGLGILALRLRLSRLAFDAGATLALRGSEIGPWIGLSIDVLR